MYWLSVLLAVITGVAAAIVDDFRPRPAAPQAAPQAAPKAPKASQAPDGAPIKPAETPIEVAVAPREGVPSILPLVASGPRVVPAKVAPERKPGESRRRRRPRPGTSESEAHPPEAVEAEHVCPTCGTRSPKPPVDRSLHTPDAPTVQLVEADVAETEAAAANPSTAEANTSTESTITVDAAPATDESPETAPEAAPEPARRRSIRERLTMQLATRRALLRLVDHPTAPDGAGEEGRT